MGAHLSETIGPCLGPLPSSRFVGLGSSRASACPWFPCLRRASLAFAVLPWSWFLLCWGREWRRKGGRVGERREGGKKGMNEGEWEDRQKQSPYQGVRKIIPKAMANSVPSNR